MATQWRVVLDGWGGRLDLGLDYDGARAGLDLAGVEMTPKLWADVRAIETGALEAMREER